METRDRSLTTAFMSGYPPMLTDLEGTASKLGYLLVTMPSASTVEAACRDLSSIVSTLNKRFQNS